jgi:hypothetical protein
MVFSTFRESVMIANDILNEDVSDFATRLEAMTSDEVFAVMRLLEKHSENDASDREDALSRITLVEEEIPSRRKRQTKQPTDLKWTKSSNRFHGNSGSPIILRRRLSSGVAFSY